MSRLCHFSIVAVIALLAVTTTGCTIPESGQATATSVSESAPSSASVTSLRTVTSEAASSVQSTTISHSTSLMSTQTQTQSRASSSTFEQSKRAVVTPSSRSRAVGSFTSTGSASAPQEGWSTYHGSEARTGAAFPGQKISEVSPLWEQSGISGAVYAQPVTDGSLIFIGTEQNIVYGLNKLTGKIVWHTFLGDPEPRSRLPCGDISPLGITGTPVIDTRTHRLFVVAEIAGGAHRLFSLDTRTGRILTSVSADPPGAQARYLQQRSALSWDNGQVYVPYGGLYGDCGPYHGYLLAFNDNSLVLTDWYQVPTAREGGIWAPSGIAIDSTGQIFIATGNGSSTRAYDYGDSVIHLSPALTVEDWFAPSNWAELNAADLDLGSVGPTLLAKALLFQIGKGGVGYLLKANHLGHIGGAVFQQRVCPSGGLAFGGTAFNGSTLFVACSTGLVALNVNVHAQHFVTVWQRTGFFTESPIITGNIVWSVDRTAWQLVGYDIQSSQVRYRSDLPQGTHPHFLTPSVVGSMIVIGSGSSVEAYRLVAQ